jgi:hypothetical protein
MKKLIIITASVLLIIITFSFKKMQISTIQSSKLVQDMENISLNGISESYASAMMDHFAKMKAANKHPIATSIWLSKKEIHEIVTLLETEKGTGLPNTPGVTDGFRIYFACDTFAKHYPLNTSIILVSTRDNGKSDLSTIECPSQRKHLDYYEHNSNAGLFKMGYISGEICYGKGNCVGAKLYHPGIYIDDPTCPPGRPHHIRTQLARHMVAKFENHVINTVSEWFGLGVLEEIDADAKPSGIRIYFATHPLGLSKKEKPFSNRDAFVIVPTKWNSKTKSDDDYFDCKTDSYFTKKIMLLSLTAGGNGQGEDDGELCPTNCN